jgi:hypothetical protein
VKRLVALAQAVEEASMGLGWDWEVADRGMNRCSLVLVLAWLAKLWSQPRRPLRLPAV